jgi:hypothetical protein
MLNIYDVGYVRYVEHCVTYVSYTVRFGK